MSRWWFGERDGKVIIMGKNGQPARSKSGHLFSAIKNVSASEGNDKKVVITTEDRSVSLDISKFSPMDGDLIHNLSAEMSSAEFALHAEDLLAVDGTSPVLASTPYTKKRGRSSSKTDIPAKRQVIERADTFDEDLKEKCLGEYSVPLTCLQKPPAELLLRVVDAKHKEKIKERLKATKSCNTVLPVLLMGHDFTSNKPEASEFYTLGGNHLTAALKELCDDPAYEALKTVRVKVFHGLQKMQALRVASLHNVSTLLVQGGNLSDNVKLCRRLLYSIQGGDEQLDEPPASNKLWREQCALALGSSDPVCQKGLKALEPTFQLAQYSLRCYAKLLMVFTMHQEKTGQCLKQTAFMKLQGLPEPTRFELLSEVVSDSLTISNMKKEAERVKKLLCVQKELLAQLPVHTWQDAERLYPYHTTETALQPFTGCNFKNGIPRPFMSFLTCAKEWKDRQTSVGEDEPRAEMLHNDASCIVFLDSYAQLSQENINGFTGAVAIVADMEENTDVFREVCEIIKSCGHIQGHILVRVTADTVSDVRRLLKMENLQGIVNLYRFHTGKKGGTMSVYVMATWRVDGARATCSDDTSDRLLQTEVLDLILKEKTKETDWIVDVTRNGEAALFAASNRRSAVYIQESKTTRREVKKKVAAGMQVSPADDNTEDEDEVDSYTYSDTDMGTSIEDE